MELPSPKISVVIPLFNASEFIGQTLESVQSQTVPVDEIVVVDDGSTDGSAELVASYSPDVRLIRKANGGAATARNRGLHEVSNEWVAFLDADDIWEPNKIEMQIDELGRKPDSVCIHSGFYLFDGVKKTQEETSLEYEVSVENLILHPLVNTSTALIRHQGQLCFPEFAGVGGDGEDMIFFAELRRHGPFAFVPHALSGYRMHPGQTTKSIGNEVRHFKNRFKWVTEAFREANAIDGLGDRVSFETGLMNQLVDWIDRARWNRKWDTYHELKEFAKGLNWPEGEPAVIDESVYPRWFYSVKDCFDRLLQGFQRR